MTAKPLPSPVIPSRSGSVQLPRPGWRDRAACIDTDPDDWDVISYDSRSRADADGRRAFRSQPMEWQKDRCRHCPVLRDCLAEAFVLGDREVIRGGVSLSHVTATNRRMLGRKLTDLGVEMPA